MAHTVCMQGKGGMEIMDAVKKSIEDAEEYLNEVKEEAAVAADKFNSVKGDLHTFEQENAEELIDGFMAFHTNVNNEDMGICEAVQSGMSSAPANGGRFSFRFEETIHRFQVTKDSEATPSPQRRLHIHTRRNRPSTH